MAVERVELVQGQLAQAQQALAAERAQRHAQLMKLTIGKLGLPTHTAGLGRVTCKYEVFGNKPAIIGCDGAFQIWMECGPL